MFALAFSCLASSGLGVGCAHRGPAAGSRFDFFGPAGASDDIWFEKVAEWQERARSDETAPLHESHDSVAPTSLQGAMAGFALGERRELAERVHLWSRLEGRSFYQTDGDGSELPEYDHWPTVSELLEKNGDDCDGLDLIPYQLLRDFGFPSDEVYRLIVRRDEDGVNHMVTLWFESPRDPWVLDATGAMTRRMRRFSDLMERGGWTPVKMFNEDRQFGVVDRQTEQSDLALH